MDCKESKELLGLYGAGAVTPEESRGLEAHLHDCAACAAEYHAVEETRALLPFALDGPEPPARVRRALLERVQQEEPQFSGTRTFSVFGFLLRPAFSYTLLVLSLIVMAFVVSEQRRYTRDIAAANAEAQVLRSQIELTREQLALIQSPATTILNLKGQAVSPRAVGKVYWDKSKGVWLVYAWQLPSPPRGKAYELWFLTKGAPVQAGMLSFDAAGNAFAEVSIPDGVIPTNAAVSLEPSQGISAPTGAIYLVGS
jgi:hypothetical protein